MPIKTEKNIIIIAGPTASGKTAFSIQLARQIGAEIISADSRQIYQKVNIGTGKPTAEQLSQVPHHLISSADPNYTITAGEFAAKARNLAAQIQSRRNLVLVVGGTGLWIKAFIDGLAPTPESDLALRQWLNEKLRQEGKASLHAKLSQVDPATAARIPPADAIRVMRALEIFYLTGQPASEVWSQPAQVQPLDAQWFALEVERKELYLRAEARIHAWMQAGWLKEVQTLLAEGLSPQAPALKAIGYSHLVRHLQGEFSLDRAQALICRDTRRYIKRQYTWFRAEKRIKWIQM